MDALEGANGNGSNGGSADTENPPSHISLDRFKIVIQHFESKLQHTLLQALSSKEYMHVRSAMIALSKVVSTFPATGRVAPTSLAQGLDTNGTTSNLLLPYQHTHPNTLNHINTPTRCIHFVTVVTIAIARYQVLCEDCGAADSESGSYREGSWGGAG